MRKMLYILFAGIFFWGCKKDKSRTVTIVPISPAELTATVISTTQVNLTWTDKSTNETGFKIQRKTGAASFSDVGTVGSDITSYSDNGLTPNTTYTYRVYAYNTGGSSNSYTNEVSVTTFAPAVLTTIPITDVSNNTAKSGGNITNDGGTTVTARGVVWSTSPNPTVVLPTKTTDGTGTGSFTSSITGLSTNTTYYIRAYATNSAGTSYGNEVSFKTTNFNLNLGLAAYYPFSGNAGDSSGNNNHGTVSGNVVLTTDRKGTPNSAYNFVYGYISVPYSSSLGVQQKLSVSVWLLSNGGNCNPRVLEMNSRLNVCGGYSLSFDGNLNSVTTFHTANFSNCTNGVQLGTTSPTITKLEWHHVVYTVDGTTGIGKIYIDGALAHTYSGTVLTDINYNNNPLTIGNSSPGRCDAWVGKLDEIRIYNRILTQEEVSYLYNN